MTEKLPILYEFWGYAEKYIGLLGAIMSIALGGPFLIGAVAPFSLAL